jgi:hypothetical protein
MDHKNGQGGYNCVGILSQASTFPGLGMMVSAGMTGSGEFRRIILDHLFKPILHRLVLSPTYQSTPDFEERKYLTSGQISATLDCMTIRKILEERS